MIMGQSNGAFLFKNMAAVKEPEALSILPLATGWQLLAVALLVYLICRVWRVIIRYRRNRYRRAALKDLKMFIPIYPESAELFSLMKSVSVVVESSTASLQGDDFLQWLDDYLPNDEMKFDDEIGQLWQQSCFDPKCHLTNKQWGDLCHRCECWLRHHPLAKVNT
ncbi:DUF4381 family protein [Vibrio tasmaniensis]|uniref:DUF4381 family protein n=1 Tax=Vibrio tasmaniensis TaxID=212663 RepID=UPI001117D370|nr:DUF4381 family protein [Vibrio tasmaniensis]